MAEARLIRECTKDEFQQIMEHITNGDNFLLSGGAGSGKSRFFIKPNILQLNASFVITDPSGEMVTSMGNVLKEHG